MSALDDLVRAGKVRYVGCSNFSAWRLARAIGRSEALGLARFDSVQPRYNALYRVIERDLLPLCAEEGIGVIPYNPLAGGLLTGKHSFGEGPSTGTRFALDRVAGRYQDRYWHEQEFATVDRIKALAAEAGITPASLAVGWVLAQPAITSPIVGASRPEQLDDAIAAAESPLDDDLVTAVDELTTSFIYQAERA